MRFFIFVLILITTTLFLFAGHWTVSICGIGLLVFFLLIWSLSERLVLKSFTNLHNLQETLYHPVEKKIQEQFKQEGINKVHVWSTNDNVGFQFYCFGSKNSAHLIFTENILNELSPKEILKLSEFAVELINKKLLSKQLIWSSIIIALNHPLKAFDRLISFFSGLKTDNGEPRRILRKLNTWFLLTVRKTNITKAKSSRRKKNAYTTLTDYSYISFDHSLPALKPISVVDYALK